MVTAKTGSAAGLGAARAVVGAGSAGVLGGLAAWLIVRGQLAREKITVPAGAARLGGRQVRGPLTAFAEADYIRQVTERATGGRAYGELSEDDPAGPLAQDAALLRASLFTSILAFGVSAAGMAVGAVLLVIGRALARA